MSAQKDTSDLASRLEHALHGFLQAVSTSGSGPQTYLVGLAELLQEVAEEKKQGRLDERLSRLGRSVAAALQSMAGVFLEIEQKGHLFQAQLGQGQSRQAFLARTLNRL
jgi:hypothetical protein